MKKQDAIQNDFEPLEKYIDQIQSVFECNARVIGLVAETQARNNYEVEKHILNTGPVAFSTTFFATEAMAQHFQKHNIPSIARWRHVRYLWDQVKEIPVDVRMKKPFQHGNVCEDPERFLALSNIGLNATEILCPQCPVYTDCQEQGYLSQPKSFQQVNTQLFGHERTFLKQNSTVKLEKLLEPINDTERICIINEVNVRGAFPHLGISRKQLETWSTDWKGFALGSYAQALLHALEMKPEPDDLLVNRIRTVMQAFEPSEKEIITQMCQITQKARGD